MSSEIRASSALSTPAVQARQIDSGTENQLFSLDSGDRFSQMLEQQVQARREAERVEARRDDQIQQDRDEALRVDEARRRQDSGKALPPRHDQARDDSQARPAGSADDDRRHTVEDHRTAARTSEQSNPTGAAGNARADSSANSSTQAQAQQSDETAADAAQAQQAKAEVQSQRLDSDAATDRLEENQADASASGKAQSQEQFLDKKLKQDAVIEQSLVLTQQQEKGQADDVQVAEEAQNQVALDADIADQAQPASGKTQDADKTKDKGEDLAVLVPVAVLHSTQQAKATSAETKSAEDAKDADLLTSAGSKGKPSDLQLKVGPNTDDKSQTATGSHSSKPESWELGPELTQAQKAQEAKEQDARIAAPAVDKTHNMKEQLVALAQQISRRPETASQKADTRKVDSTADVKGMTFSRSLEQVANARSDAARPVSTGIQSPVFSRAWAGELGQRLVMMVSSKIKSAEIHLNPKDLGPVDVRIKMHEDKAHVVFSSHVPQTRDALEQAVPRLREMFDQNGVALGNVNVQDQGAQQSHQRQGRDEQQGNGRGMGRGDGNEVEAAASVTSTQVLGLVDFYA